jgi:hypothetical protein
VWNKKFPSYSSKPTPVSAGTLAQGTSALRAVAKARRIVKTEIASDEAKEIIEYGTHVCKSFFPNGRVIRLEGGAETACCTYDMIKDERLKPAMSEPLLKEMPMGTGSWKDDVTLRRFVMRFVIPNIKLNESNETRLFESIRGAVKSFFQGVELTHTIDIDKVPLPILEELLSIAKEYKIEQELIERLEAYIK